MFDSLRAFFRRPNRKPVQEMIVPVIHFLGEQAGPVERKLQSRLTPVLNANQSISQAYLAIIRHGTQEQTQVALCLYMKAELTMADVKSVHHVFAQIFNRDCPLDIFQLSDSQLREVSSVCQPFFVRGSAA